MLKLTTENVNKILLDCLFKDGEQVVDPVMVEGIVRNFGFNKSRLDEHQVEISELLSNLPKEFQKDSGGGYSFLNGCMTKDGTQWGEQNMVEELMCLGLATGQVEILLPRELWESLPGGVPYFVVNPLP